MDPSLSSPSTSVIDNANTSTMPPRPLKRSASSELPLPSSSPSSSSATKRQRSLYDFFSRSSSPAVPPANGLKREPVMSPTPGHAHTLSSPLAASSSSSSSSSTAAGAAAAASQTRPAPTSPTMSRSTTQQRSQASASSSASSSAAPAPTAAPAPARPTPAAISLQLSDSSDDENKVAPATPEPPRRVRGRPNIRPMQIEILDGPPRPTVIDLRTPSPQPATTSSVIYLLSSSSDDSDSDSDICLVRRSSPPRRRPAPIVHDNSDSDIELVAVTTVPSSPPLGFSTLLDMIPPLAPPKPPSPVPRAKPVLTPPPPPPLRLSMSPVAAPSDPPSFDFVSPHAIYTQVSSPPCLFSPLDLFSESTSFADDHLQPTGATEQDIEPPSIVSASAPPPPPASPVLFSPLPTSNHQPPPSPPPLERKDSNHSSTSSASTVFSFSLSPPLRACVVTPPPLCLGTSSHSEVPPLPLAVGPKRPAVAPAPVVALAESKNVNASSTQNGRVLRPRTTSAAQPLEHPAPTTPASSTTSSSSSSRYVLRTRPAPAPTSAYTDLTFSPSPPRALPQPNRATATRNMARRGGGRRGIQHQPPRSLMRTLSSSSSLSDLSSLSDDERDEDGDDLDIVSIAPRPARTPARPTAAAAAAAASALGAADSSPLTSVFSSRVHHSSPPASPGASPGSCSDRSASTLSTATGTPSLGFPFALGRGMSGFVVSESEDDEDETTAASPASLPHFACPFCGNNISTAWADVIDDVYQRILGYMPPLVKKTQMLHRQTRESKLEFILKHQFDASLSKNMADHVQETKAICAKHKRRTVMLEANAKGWPAPESIDWDALGERIRTEAFLDMLDGVVESYHKSPYGGVYAHMVKVYNECGGGARYRNQAMLSKKLEMNRVGYYGQRGAFDLFNALADAFLHDPQSALGDAELGVFRDSEFVSDILVPTAGVILIQQDMQARLGREVSFDEAWQMMKETADYGDVIAPLQKT